MLNVEGIETDLEEAREFADKVGKRENLERCLERLENLFNQDGTATCYLGLDFAPYSFTFAVTKDGKTFLNGGLIYHGQHDRGGDGGAPTFSVSLTPQDGWSIHT